MKITIDYTGDSCTLKTEVPANKKEVMAILCASLVETGKTEIKDRDVFIEFITNLLKVAWDTSDAS